MDGSAPASALATAPVGVGSSAVLRFPVLGAAPPTVRPAAERVGDFREIAAPYDPAAGRAQASRCSSCGVPFCQTGCPLQNNIPDWLGLAAEGRMREAYAASAATNPMPEVCGRVCPQDRLCEAACVIEEAGFGAVTIGAVEKHITDTAWTEGWVEPIRVGAPSGRSVGIIGAGPAGLAAAEALRGSGHDVTIYDRHDRPGGLLVYGIPHFKLDKGVVRLRTDRLAAGGVAFVLGADIGGPGFPFARLEAAHDAILIATGVYAPRPLAIPGVNAAGVWPALPFLTAANRRAFGDAQGAGPDFDAAGARVVVIGGGDTAMDCVRTAVRQGAASVVCLYRRDRDNMPGSPREVRSAEAEGVRFVWMAAPRAILETGGQTTGVLACATRLGPPDASGRRPIEEDRAAAFVEPADRVILALGFEPEDTPRLFGAPDLTLTRAGNLDTRPLTARLSSGAGMTARPGVFAAGDIVRGASLVVWALKDGLDAAADIDLWLAGLPARVRLAAAE